MHYFIFFVIIIIGTDIPSTNSVNVLNWLWDKTEEDTTVVIPDGMPLTSIPFEAMTEDEKFLREASKLSDLQISSPLATCQHKVIMRIKTSCSDMTEEELAKLSVNLLNCQSAVEGRKIFPCTDEMSLKQCTTDMDADMWNAYHLMSNRARAVCYAARSTQFRALTELTVNKLMNSAHTQIKALNSLKESQDKLGERTIEALSTLSEGNEILLKQQEYLKDAQASSHQLVTSNLRDLNNEKALIRAGHAQLAAMTSDIKNKLETASQQLLEQTVERNENHLEVIKDLVDVQEQIQLIWDKIESSTERIIEKHESAIDQYEQTLLKLSQINDTVQFIWDVTNKMRTEIDDKLGWIQTYIGNTGEQMHKIYRVGLHVVYLLGAMVVASFLQAPLITRITIVGIVPMNLISYLKNGLEACLDLPSITVLIILITFMHFVMSGIQYIFGATRIQKRTKGYHLSSYVTSMRLMLWKNMYKLRNTIVYSTNYCKDKIRNIANQIESCFIQQDTTFEELSCSYTSASKSIDNVLLNSLKQEYILHRPDATDSDENHDMSLSPPDLRHRMDWSSRLRNRSFTPPSALRESNVTWGKRCNAYTRSGKKCSIFVPKNHHYCPRHLDGSSTFGD